MNNIWLALVTGLTTGGISCLAVQGGLLTSSIAQDEVNSDTKFGRAAKVGSFLVAKLLSYTLLGFGLGALGSTLVLSPIILGWMQISAGLFMLLTALRLLNVHPIFRYFVIQPPKFIFKLLRSESKSRSLFGPATLGFLTVLIPCGVTQAMMALSVASANPFSGAAIMFAFTLGTSPIFFALGIAAMEFLKRKWFSYLASGAIAFLALVSINTGQILRSSPHTFQNYWKVLTQSQKTTGRVAGISSEGKQEVTIDVLSFGYKASANTLKKGIPVKLSLQTNNTKGCARAFTIPAFNIAKTLPPTGVEVIEFTPQKPGLLTYTCSMGMYTGEFTVVN